MPRDFALYLDDLILSCNRIMKFTAGLDQAAFVENDLVQAAVERQFTILGEAVRQMREHYPVRMRTFEDANKIVGIRNVIIHEYLYVNVEAVWSAVRSKIPELRARLVELRLQQDSVS